MNKVKAVIVGLNFGQWVIENELLNGSGKEYIELTGVCDLNKAKVDSMSRKYNVKGYYDIDEVLADGDVEAVILITGPVGRAKLVDKIISKGKPVMTTKPFDTSSVETLAVLKKAKELKIPVFMNSPAPLLTGELKKMKDWIDQYNLGRPIGYRATTWCSYREKADGSWYDDNNLCPVAPIFRLGIYLINDICRLLPPVKKVNVLQSRIFTGRPTADNAQLGILHEDGTIGCIYASFCIDDKQYYRCSIEMNFQKGTVYKNVGPVEQMDEGKIVMQVAANVDGKFIVDKAYLENQGTGYPWDTFYKAVRGQDVGETVSPESVASAIRILEEIRGQSVNTI